MGAAPKLIMSDNESISVPNFVALPALLASRPSRKSNTSEAPIRAIAILYLPVMLSSMLASPLSRLSRVAALPSFSSCFRL